MFKKQTVTLADVEKVLAPLQDVVNGLSKLHALAGASAADLEDQIDKLRTKQEEATVVARACHNTIKQFESFSGGMVTPVK